MVALTQIVLSISVFPDSCERFIHVIHNMQRCLIIHVVIPGNAFYKSTTEPPNRESATHETLMFLFLWAYTFILIVSHISINVTYFLLF